MLAAAGVLEFIEQDVFIARIQAALDIGSLLFVGQQAISLPFKVGEVKNTLLGLDFLVTRQIGATHREQGLVQSQYRNFAATPLQLQ